MTLPIKDFMEQAIKLSIDNVINAHGGPFGAIIVKNNNIIAQGVNLVTATNDPTAHAEITAIRAACKILRTYHLTDCIVYSSCEPCPMCLGALYWAHIHTIFFANTRDDAAAIGFNDAFIYHELQLPREQRSSNIQQFMRKEALRAFQLWQTKENKIHY